MTSVLCAPPCILFGAGLISKGKRDEYLQIEETIQQLIKEERFTDATDVTLNYILFVVPTDTGYHFLYDLISNGPPAFQFNLTQFTNLDSTRRALHVGNITYREQNPEMADRFRGDFTKSSASKLDELLKNGYSALILFGNADLVTGLGLRKTLVESLTWEGKDDLVEGNRTIWREGESVAGYITNSQQARLIIMRNAGHVCYMFKPEWTLKAVVDFIDG